MPELEEIYQRYFKEVYYFLYHLSHDKHLAEDLTSETFFKVMKSLDSFNGQSEIRTWLFQIAKNTYFSYFRKKRVMVDIDEIPEKASGINIEKHILLDEKITEIYQKIYHLSEPYQEVFCLRMFAELDFKAIGTLFGKSANWACVTFYRARKKIKEEMEWKE